MKVRCAALLLLVACSDDGNTVKYTVHTDAGGQTASTASIVGDGMLATEARSASGFQRVTNDSSLSVEINQGAAFKVEVTIDSNLLQYVKTEVAGDTLSVRVETPSGFSSHGGRVAIVVPLLLSVHTTGSGSTEVDMMQTQPLSVRTDGSGAISLAGSAPSADLSTNGSGGIDASAFRAVDGTLGTFGSGDIIASFSGSVDATTTGSGSIELSGGATVTQHRSGSGSISSD